MTARSKFIQEFSRAIIDDYAGIFVGAGTSMAAGYPSWKELLADIADELEMTIDDYDDLAAIAQWSIHEDGANRTRVSQAIFDQISPDKAIPQSLEVIARLPISELWTTNYDRLLERALSAAGRPYDLKANQGQLSLRSPSPGSVRIYKMHGTIDDTSEIVIATDDYELYQTKREAFLNLFQAHLMSRTFLFLGVSLSDPNIRHILASIRRFFPQLPPRHFLITKTPERAEFATQDAYEARIVRHKFWAKDLRRYGFRVVEVDSYSKIDELLLEIEREIAKHRVWVAGSWIEDDRSENASRVREIAEQIGLKLAKLGLTLVSGSGLVVGPSGNRGFLNGLQTEGVWDLQRRFIVRPFPQPNPGRPPDLAQWARLREEMARLSGCIVVIGGLKRTSDGDIVLASGVDDEIRLVTEKKGLVIPVGSTGGTAEVLLTQLLHSAHGKPTQITADELTVLGDRNAAASQVADVVGAIIMRYRRGENG